MIKVIKKTKTLTDKQKEMMKQHSSHHTDKHMSFMKNLMLSGKTFKKAHEMAQKKIGK